MPTSAGASPPVRFRVLLQRERECTFVRERLSAAGERSGSALVLTAPVGMGKTRLLAAISAMPSTLACTVIAARALASTWITSPAKADRYHSSAFHVALSDGTEAVHTTSAFRSLVGSVVRDATAERPAFVLLDDAQSADDSTLRFFSTLAASVADAPLVFILTVHTEDRAFRPLLAATANAIESSPAGYALTLPALDDATLREAIREAARETHELPESTQGTIVERAAGNPYVAEELLRSWIARGGDPENFDPPATVSASIIERAGRLTRPTQKILRLCSAIGPTIDVRLLGAVADVAPAELDDALVELCNAHFLCGYERLVFAHETVQEAVAATFLAEEARAWHRTILAELRAREAESLTIAHHAILARDADASALAETAGDVLAGRNEHPEAIRFYEAARGAALAPHRLGPLLLKLAAAYDATDEDARALEVTVEAVHLFAADREFERARDAAASAMRYAKRLGETSIALAMRSFLDTPLPASADRESHA